MSRPFVIFATWAFLFGWLPTSAMADARFPVAILSLVGILTAATEYFIDAIWPEKK